MSNLGPYNQEARLRGDPGGLLLAQELVAHGRYAVLNVLEQGRGKEVLSALEPIIQFTVPPPIYMRDEPVVPF